MMIRHTRTLVYCDGPQVIEARADDGEEYVGVKVDSDGDNDRYLLKCVTAVGFRKFLAGNLDLRSLILGGSEKNWFLGVVAGVSGEFHDLTEHKDLLEFTGFLPDAGFIFAQP